MAEPISKLGLILDTITDGVIVVDQQGIVLYANQSTERLLERQDLIGKSLAIPLNPSLERQELNLVRPSGFALVEFCAMPIEWDGVSGYVISMTDITVRRQAELSLKNSERLFHTLATIAPVGIFRSDAQGMCEYVNERWCQIAGISFDEAMQAGWGKAIHIESA